jgi:hypothetical protein
MIQGTSSYETNSGTLLSRNSPTLKFQQDKVFTLGTITIPTEFKNYKNLKWLHLSIRQSTLGVLTQSGVYKTHQTKFSQSIILNPNQWQNATDLKNSVRFIIKPPSLLIENKKGGNFELNPFNSHKKMYWG